jgi:hypothetical protein
MLNSYWPGSDGWERLAPERREESLRCSLPNRSEESRIPVSIPAEEWAGHAGPIANRRDPRAFRRPGESEPQLENCQ